MKTVTRIGLCATAALLGASMLGGTAMQFSAAFADEKDAAAARKTADKVVRQAQRMLAADHAAQAASLVEEAVALVPGDAGYRALLGQAYLSSGRFLSAAQALSDALSLDPSNGRAALNLALSQIGQGDWQSARETLDAHAAHIAPADRGLAIALSGDPMGAVQLLGDAARSPDADAKVRQNLALSLALAGRWPEAKTIAEIDLSPADVHQRMLQWASFVRPTNSWDQVATLLGVTPVADPGQPVRLALHAPVNQMAAVSQPVVPVEAYMAQVEPAAAVSMPVPDAPQAAAAPVALRIVFAERREVVQAIPAHWQAPVQRASLEVPPRLLRGSQGVSVPGRTAQPSAALARDHAPGEYHVQLGAFQNAAVARDAWRRMSTRAAALRSQKPYGADVTVGGRTLYRLSVGGFARNDAAALCRTVRARGGQCFVRAQAGDAIASWGRGPQLAAR